MEISTDIKYINCRTLVTVQLIPSETITQMLICI